MLQSGFASAIHLTGFGLFLAATLITAVLFVVLCTCFHLKDGMSISGEDKNGHIYPLGRKELTDIESPEATEESLAGGRAASHRRLPDIPDPLAGTGGSMRSSQDTTSELYAQVEIGANSDSFQAKIPQIEAGNSTISGGPVAQYATESEEVSFVNSHPYDKVKSNHGYSKIKKKGENPYAKVRRSDTMESETAEPDENETDTDNYDVVDTLHSSNQEQSKKRCDPESPNISGSSVERGMEASNLLPPPLPLPQRGSHSSLVGATSNESGTAVPLPPPRGRRGQSVIISHGSSNGSLHRPNSVILNLHVAESGLDESDGRGAEEILRSADLAAVGAPQIHFSGDSQASQDSKGYSSISVREPLANLKTQSSRGRNSRVLLRDPISESSGPITVDPHYATVSDAEDSDEMYAAIAEPHTIYSANGGPESDTYAKINDGRNIQNTGGMGGSINNSTVYLHPSSPMASSSSSIGLDRTAEPIERSSSSPVPPTPPSVVSLRQISVGSSRLHASTLSISSQTSGVGSPKPEKRQANSPLPPPPYLNSPVDSGMVDGIVDRNHRKSINVEEMYAKVMKKRGLSIPAPYSAQHRGSLDLGLLGTNRERDGDDPFNPYLMRDNGRRNSVDSSPHTQRPVDHDFSGAEMAGGVEVLSGVSAVVEEDDEEDFRYEILPALRRGDASQRKISECDPGYEKIQLKSADSFNDPRYERIHLKNPQQPPSESEMEPNYEIVRYQDSLRISEPGYEEVEVDSRGFTRGDPNYESLHYTDDAHYSVCNKSHVDPPYDKVDKDDVGDAQPTEAVQRELADSSSAQTPLYAQVVKPKRHVAAGPTDDAAPDVNVVLEEQDFSVSSSDNTTIIRITAETRQPSFRYFPGDDALGVPEQV